MVESITTFEQSEARRMVLAAQVMRVHLGGTAQGGHRGSKDFTPRRTQMIDPVLIDAALNVLGNSGVATGSPLWQAAEKYLLDCFEAAGRGHLGNEEKTSRRQVDAADSEGGETD